jgi:hypothetical protein
VATEATDESVSREAFERVKSDYEKAKQALADKDRQLTDAAQALRDVNLIDKAYSTFKTLDGVTDPYALARRAARDVTLKDVAEEEFGPKLQSWYEEERSLWASPQPSPTPDDAAPAAETGPVPGFARPSPASTGTPPTPDKLTLQSPEVQEALRMNRRDLLEQWDKEGKMAWSPLVQDSFGQAR